ncbi:MAG: type I restriction endonuclease subunit R, partial [Chloroflexi bacterium]|nr:type I restriction endonuclease subunit R [Chloroflexota bacterium]
KQLAQVGSLVGAAESSRDLRRFIAEGKRIIISTVQKFPFILDAIGDEHRGRRFAIIIDEAHSGQGGATSSKMSQVLSEVGRDDAVETTEDKINRLMESRRLLPNASYFAFTATPKNKTLEIFGMPALAGEVTQHLPFHAYTMKQAIQEGFIIDVLQHYTPVQSYYRLVKTIEDDPEFDTARAAKKLRRYVEDHQQAIRQKAEIMVDHFHEQVDKQKRIGGQARAMVVTSSIKRAITYFFAIREYLKERNSPYKAIAAFSGEHAYNDTTVTEASLNGFSSNLIAEKIQEDPYRFLVCADKFQTGYDEPLLHTMYVDKSLAGVKAVQTLSRLNRAHPKKHDAFVLDFSNDTDMIEGSFAAYYRTTILSEETDPNKLHDLKADLDGHQIYSQEDVDAVVDKYLAGVERDKLDPILDVCVAVYRENLDEDGQVDFKSKAKAFLRTYGFLAAILPYNDADWEKLSIFLNFLVPKLPAPIEPDITKGILEAIDMDSYRVEKQAMREIFLPDENAEIDPVPTENGGLKPEAETDRLSNIIREFNDLFGNVDWSNRDKITAVISEELPARIAQDGAYQNAMVNADRQNARIELESALGRVVTELVADHTELYKQFHENPSFHRWLCAKLFETTYRASGNPSVQE